MREETLLAVQDCLSRSENALNDLYLALNNFPIERRSESLFSDAVKIYARAAEIELAFDEDFVTQYS